MQPLPTHPTPMRAIDYLRFLEPDHVTAAGFRVIETRRPCEDSGGIEYVLAVARGEGRQEAVRFTDELFLLTGYTAPCAKGAHRQVVTDGDWIHIQYQVRGSGHEVIGSSHPIHASPSSCVITRYPQGSIIERETAECAHYRTACLYLRPSLLRSLLGLSSNGAAPGWEWLQEDCCDEPRSAVFPIATAEVMAIDDLFATDYRRGIRRNYMYAKSLELLSHAANRLSAHGDEATAPYLSGVDRKRIATCREFLVENIAEQITLAQLARRIGVNRSKLAVGFKTMYGISLQAYWRELRLCRARELLATGLLSVTDVASAVGYADISCLTRAYHKRFGHLPKETKVGNARRKGGSSFCE